MEQSTKKINLSTIFSDCQATLLKTLKKETLPFTWNIMDAFCTNCEIKYENKHEMWVMWVTVFYDHAPMQSL